MGTGGEKVGQQKYSWTEPLSSCSRARRTRSSTCNGHWSAQAPGTDKTHWPPPRTVNKFRLFIHRVTDTVGGETWQWNWLLVFYWHSSVVIRVQINYIGVGVVLVTVTIEDRGKLKPLTNKHLYRPLTDCTHYLRVTDILWGRLTLTGLSRCSVSVSELSLSCKTDCQCRVLWVTARVWRSAASQLLLTIWARSYLRVPVDQLHLIHRIVLVLDVFSSKGLVNRLILWDYKFIMIWK